MIYTTFGEIVRAMESDYTSGSVTISKYVTASVYEDVCTIDAYLNSKYISGEFDAQGREKPFFNVVNAASNIWYRATDIDRKNMKITTDKSQQVMAAFLATIKLHEWMYRENFGTFLNNWGRVLARYGSCVTKFVKKDGRLIPSVVPWNRLIVDQVSFYTNPVIEKLELTEAELYQNDAYDKETIKALCEAVQTRKTLDGRNKDNKSNYITLYEIHGNLPLKILTGKDEDKYIYQQQMAIVSFVAKKDKADEYDDFILYSGKEEKSPYMITHLIEEDGYTLSTGAVKHLFQTQWMVNHTAKSIKDQLDLASKLIFQTADNNFVGQNALSSIETGDILVHQLNMPLTQINNSSHDISSQQAYQTSWKVLGNEIAGISESMMGNTPPSGTAWRQVETLLQENHSLFNLMKQNKGLSLEEMMTIHVIPFIKTQIDDADEVGAILEAHDIKRIDAKYVKNKSIKLAKKEIKDKFLKGELPTQEEQDQLIASIAQKGQESLNELGNQRFFVPDDLNETTWKESLKDLEWNMKVDVTDENVDQDASTTLNSFLQFLGKLNGRPMTPDESLVVSKILMKSGAVSPVEVTEITAPKPTQTLPLPASGGMPPTIVPPAPVGA